MKSFTKIATLVASTGALLLLSGCISSPLPGGTVGALYQWDDLDTPVFTTVGISNTGQDGYYDGDFDLTNIPATYPELSSSADYPWLFEACNEEQCYSVVLFSNDFKLDTFGRFQGNVAMNSVTTLMANEVRGLPADAVRATLDVLSGELAVTEPARYASFIRLDLDRDKKSRKQLRSTSYYDEATALHLERPSATVRELLGVEIARTTDLDVPSGFEFDSSWQLLVDVNLPALSSTGAYLLLCSDYETDGEEISVDYSSCPLKAPLQEGSWLGEVKLTGTVQSLAAVIMPLQNPNDPQFALWDRASDGDSFILRE